MIARRKTALAAVFAPAFFAAEIVETDIGIFGGTSGGIAPIPLVRS